MREESICQPAGLRSYYIHAVLLILIISILPGCRKKPSTQPIPFKTSPPSDTAQSTDMLLQDFSKSYGDISGELIRLISLRRLKTELKETQIRPAKSQDEDFSKLMKMGNIYLSLGDYDKAYEIFNETSRRFPRDVKSLCYLAMVRFLLGDFVKGNALVNKASAIAPQSPEPHLVKGEIWLNYWNFFDARNEFEKACSLDSKNAYIYTSYGDFYLTNEEYSRSEDMYKKALELAPREPIIIEKIGSIKILLKRYEEGIRFLNEARSISPSDLTLLYKTLLAMKPREALDLCSEELITEFHQDKDLMLLIRAQLLTREEKYDEAEAILIKIKEAFPEASLPKHLLSYVYLRKGLYGESIELLDSLIKSDPLNDRLYAMKAICHHKKGDTPHALIDCGMMLEIRSTSKINFLLCQAIYSPLKNMSHKDLLVEIAKYESRLDDSNDKATLCYFLGELNSIGKNFDRALYFYGKAAENRKNESFYLRKVAGFFLSKGKAREAEIILREALKNAPQHALVNRQMALLYIRKNDLDAALRVLDSKTCEDSKDAFNYYFRGVIYYERKKYYLALRELNKAQSIDPSFNDPFFYMASIYQALNKPQSALILYRRFAAVEDQQYDKNEETLAEARRRIEHLENKSRDKK